MNDFFKHLTIKKVVGGIGALAALVSPYLPPKYQAVAAGVGAVVALVAPNPSAVAADPTVVKTVADAPVAAPAPASVATGNSDSGV